MTRDKIAIYWDIYDVQSVRPDLDAAQAREVLYLVEKQHDAETGITWDTLRQSADYLYGAERVPAWRPENDD